MQKQTVTSDKRTAIMAATLDLIAASGFHGAPTSEIAARAGVGVGSIYRYFKDKEALIHEVFKEVSETIKIEMVRGHDPQVPLREQYIGLCHNLFRYLYAHPKFFSFTEQYFNSPYGLQHKRSLIEKEAAGKEGGHPIGELFTRARKNQVIKDLPQQVIGALTMGPIIFLIRDIHNDLLAYSEVLVMQVIEATWDGIKR